MTTKRHILICGERGAGKSTLIERLLQATARPRFGFVTKMEPAGPDGFRPVYIHPAGQPPAERVYGPGNCVGVCDSRTHRPDPKVFDTLGVRYIEAAQPGGILIMDELGFFEAQAEDFTAAVKSRRDIPFLNAVRAAPLAEVFFLTQENREALYRQLLPRMKSL